MSYRVGDIVLINFPFTNLKKFKKRPVLIVKNENKLNDIVCFQITSNSQQSNLLKIESADFRSSDLTLESFVKYDKCFTLSSDNVNKTIAQVDNQFLEKLKIIFCKELF